MGGYKKILLKRPKGVLSRRAKVEQLAPGVLRYRPNHRDGVLAALRGFNDRRNRRKRKKGITSRVEPS